MLLRVLFQAIFSSRYLTLDILSITMTWITSPGCWVYVPLPNEHLGTKIPTFWMASTAQLLKPETQDLLQIPFSHQASMSHQFYQLKFSHLPTPCTITSDLIMWPNLGSCNTPASHWSTNPVIFITSLDRSQVTSSGNTKINMSWEDCSLMHKTIATQYLNVAVDLFL